MKTFLALAVLVAVALTGRAEATTIVVRSPSQFDMLVGGDVVETFDNVAISDFAQGAVIPFAGFSLSYVQGVASRNMGVGIRPGTALGRANINDSHAVAWGEDLITNGSGRNGPVITLGFADPVNAIGFAFGDDDNSDTYGVSVSGVTYDPLTVNRSTGTGFFGIYSEVAFSSVVLSSRRASGFLGAFSLDDVRMAVPRPQPDQPATVPLPAGLPLALLGLGGLALVARWRR